MNLVVTKKLTSESLANIQKLVGQHFQFLGSPSDDGSLSSFKILFAAENTSVVVSADVEYESFEGFPNEFARLNVSVPDAAFVNATIRGNANRVFHRGEVIKRVLVIEEQFDCNDLEGNEWAYIADVGLAFMFESGSIYVSLASIHSEVIEVSSSKDVAMDGLPEVDYFFDEDLFNRLNVSRRVIELGEAS